MCSCHSLWLNKLLFMETGRKVCKFGIPCIRHPWHDAMYGTSWCTTPKYIKQSEQRCLRGWAKRGKTLVLSPNLPGMLCVVLCINLVGFFFFFYRNYFSPRFELNARGNICLIAWSIALIRASIFSVMQVYKQYFPGLLVSASLQCIGFLKCLP